MAEELITDIVSPEAHAQVEKLQKQLKTTVETFGDALASAKAFDAILRGAKGLREIQKAITDAEKAMEKLEGASTTLVTTTKKVQEAQSVAADSLAAYNRQVAALKKEYESLSSSETADVKRKEAIRRELISLQAAYGADKKALQDAKRGLDAAATSYKDLENQTANLRRQLVSMPGAFDMVTGAINKENKEAFQMQEQIDRNIALLKKMDAQMGQHFRSVGNYGMINSGLKDFATGLLGITSVGFIAAQATKAIVDSNVQISDSLTEVQRVGGLTTKQTDALYDSLKKIDTRESLGGLLDLARIGAQLGVSAGDLSGFTKAMNELSVTLGGELQGGAEGIATSLGKINGLLDITQKFGVEEGLRKTGSAILAVGQAGIATGDYLADFAERVGGVAKIAKVSLPDLLGYGAALQANGVNAELAGTTFTRLLTQLGKTPKAFYAVAHAADPKLTLKQFTDYINTDANKALQAFFEGVAKGGNNLTQFAAITKSLGLPGQRVSQVLAAISTNLGDVANNTEVANKAFQDATLIDSQYALKNDNLAGKVKQLYNEFVKITTDPQSNLGNFIKGLVADFTMGVKAVDAMIGSVEHLFGLKPNKDAADYSQMLKDQIADFAKFDQASQKTIADITAQQIAETKAAAEAKKTAPQVGIFARGETFKQRAQREQDYKDLVAKLKYLNQLYQDQQDIISGKKKAPALKPTGGTTPSTLTIQDSTAAKAAARKRAAELQSEATEQIAIDKAMRDARIKNANDEVKAEADLKQEQLTTDSQAAQEAMNDDRNTLNQRLDAFKKYIEDQKALIESEKTQELGAIQTKAEQDLLALKQRQALADARKAKGGKLNDTEAAAVIAGVELTPEDIEDVSSKLAYQKFLITQKSNDKLVNLLRSVPKQTQSILSSGEGGQNSADAISDITAQGDRASIALNNLYSSSLISEREYNKKSEDLNFQTQSAILQIKIQDQQKAVDAAKAAGLYIGESEQKLADLQKALSDETTAHIKGNEEEKKQAAMNTLDAIQQYGDEFLGILSDVAANQAAERKNELQDQIDAINKNKQAEIDAITATTLSQQDKSAKISILNAKTQAQTDELNRRQQEADEKQAKFDKAKTIFDIILGTAKAVVGVLDKPFLIPVVLALGAAELAVAAAAPIPQYFKGTDDAPGGFAMVSEQGPELMRLPDGTETLTPERPTIMYIPEHTRIKPHYDTIIELAKRQAMEAMFRVPVIDERAHEAQNSAIVAGKIDHMRKDLRQAIESIPQTNFYWTPDGIRRNMERAGNRTRYINQIINKRP